MRLAHILKTLPYHLIISSSLIKMSLMDPFAPIILAIRHIFDVLLRHERPDDMKRKILRSLPSCQFSSHEGISIDFNSHQNQIGYCGVRPMSCIPSIPLLNISVPRGRADTYRKSLCSSSRLDDTRPPFFKSF